MKLSLTTVLADGTISSAIHHGCCRCNVFARSTAIVGIFLPLRNFCLLLQQNTTAKPARASHMPSDLLFRNWAGFTGDPTRSVEANRFLLQSPGTDGPPHFDPPTWPFHPIGVSLCKTEQLN